MAAVGMCLESVLYSLIVPRPPTRIIPKRANGADTVAMLGVMSRITATLAGFEGISFEDMVMVRLGCVSLLGGSLDIDCQRL